ncbi:MAG: CDP-diacylglycerol--serine O-phosphatidyltransferase [Deltaproteobacteria bacterium]|nr:CDP-diacylglycerol--serine O-phosphatidyltransferase [Deltaproteobacteria bacterium]
MRLTRSDLRERLYQRRFLVPNALTLGNMFCGFLTIIYATSGRFEKAAIAIGFSILLDGLDGRLARRLNATSKFGVEFDSFSDLVSFGIGPAILIYNWCFRLQADEFGVFITFVYALCAASRLARFNVSDPNPLGFVGLPTPGAAGMIAAVVNVSPVVHTSTVMTACGAVLMLTLAYLMISKIPFVKIKLHKRVGLNLIGTLALGALIAIIWYNNQLGFLLLATGYCISGPLSAISAGFRERVKQLAGMFSVRPRKPRSGGGKGSGGDGVPLAKIK